MMRLEDIRRQLAEITIDDAAYEDMQQKAAEAATLSETINHHYAMLSEGRPIRPRLGNEMQILYMRDRQVYSFLLFPELLDIEYQVAKVIGAHYVAPYLSGDTLPEIVQGNVVMCDEHKYAFQEIVEVDETHAVYRNHECADCFGLPDIGMKLCVYEAGTAAGGIEERLGRAVKVTETKCCAHGDPYCEFHVEVL